MTHTWRDRCRERKQRQADSIPPEWLIQIPENQLNVMDVPRTCGLLDSPEIEITDAAVNVLLSNLASGHWTCVDVTKAFYKRAIIAHQLVGFICGVLKACQIRIVDKLPDRNLRSSGVGKSQILGQAFEGPR